VLGANREAILARLRDEDLVLDVGAGASPFPRADWVLDLMRYEDRGLYGEPSDPSRERFTPDTWVVRDICDREPWPFADRHFDFAVCSHTLEDVRDPIWVCSELMRVAKAGYIEVPSRLEEQSYGFQGPWVGWGHHRWLIDLEGDELTFVFKHHIVHGRDSDHFPAGFRDRLAPEQRVQSLFWEGGFRCRERMLRSAEEADAYVAEFVDANRGLDGASGARRPRWRRR
jgi:SAM-dependent methyltransferase